MLTLNILLQTEYHRSLAASDWSEKLEQHINASLLSHPEYLTSNGKGNVWSKYNEERFMGPRSLIKNDFEVELHISRPFSFRKDHYRASVRYSVDTQLFSNLNEYVTTVEIKKRDQYFHRVVNKQIKRIKRGLSRSEIENWRCPWCKGHIEFYFASGGFLFSMSCPLSHFRREEITKLRPAWWQQAVSNDWIIEDM
jgi:hypothetical protein